MPGRKRELHQLNENPIGDQLIRKKKKNHQHINNGNSIVTIDLCSPDRTPSPKKNNRRILPEHSEINGSPNNRSPIINNHYERLLSLREQRNVGLYVQCNSCRKYRYLEDVKDPLELPQYWYCRYNPDKKYNKCKIPEAECKENVNDMIYNEYHAGSIVWAKFPGYPWWPSMVDDDPNIEQYYWIPEVGDVVPTKYHVVFLDSNEVTRAWISTSALHKYKGHEDDPRFVTGFQFEDCLERIEFGKRLANEALEMSVEERLKSFGFIARWPHPINAPSDIPPAMNHPCDL